MHIRLKSKNQFHILSFVEKKNSCSTRFPWNDCAGTLTGMITFILKNGFYENVILLLICVYFLKVQFSVTISSFDLVSSSLDLSITCCSELFLCTAFSLTQL